MITVTCVIYQPKGSKLVHRGLVFKVLQSITKSALLHVAGNTNPGNWEVVREPELFMNGSFADFENRIIELWTSPPISQNATFELRYDEYTDQVSREYMLQHGFSRENKPWSGLAKFYSEGPPDSKRKWSEEYRIAVETTGFGEYGYKEADNTDLDAQHAKFDPDELSKAEDQAGLLHDAGLLD